MSPFPGHGKGLFIRVLNSRSQQAHRLQSRHRPCRVEARLARNGQHVGLCETRISVDGVGWWWRTERSRLLRPPPATLVDDVRAEEVVENVEAPLAQLKHDRGVLRRPAMLFRVNHRPPATQRFVCAEQHAELIALRAEQACR